MRAYATWIGIAVLCLIVYLAGDGLAAIFQFDRDAITRGEYWRLLTSHVTHLSFAHLTLNLLALALCTYVANPKHAVAYILAMWLWLMAFTGVGLYFYALDLNYYVGLSGALHGALLIAIVPSPYYSRFIRILVVVVILGKVMWEQTSFYNDMGNAELIGGRTEARSHMLGAIAGLIWVLGYGLWKVYEQRKQSLEDE